MIDLRNNKNQLFSRLEEIPIFHDQNLTETPDVKMVSFALIFAIIQFCKRRSYNILLILQLSKNEFEIL